MARRVFGIEHYGPEYVFPKPAESPEPCLGCRAVRHWLQESRLRPACGHSGAHGTPRLPQLPPGGRLWRRPGWLLPVSWQTAWAEHPQTAGPAGPLLPEESAAMLLQRPLTNFHVCFRNQNDDLFFRFCSESKPLLTNPFKHSEENVILIMKNLILMFIAFHSFHWTLTNTIRYVFSVKLYKLNNRNFRPGLKLFSSCIFHVSALSAVMRGSTNKYLSWLSDCIHNLEFHQKSQKTD